MRRAVMSNSILSIDLLLPEALAQLEQLQGKQDEIGTYLVNSIPQNRPFLNPTLFFSLLLTGTTEYKA